MSSATALPVTSRLPRAGRALARTGFALAASLGLHAVALFALGWSFAPAPASVENAIQVQLVAARAALPQPLRPARTRASETRETTDAVSAQPAASTPPSRIASGSESAQRERASQPDSTRPRSKESRAARSLAPDASSAASPPDAQLAVQRTPLESAKPRFIPPPSMTSTSEPANTPAFEWQVQAWLAQHRRYPRAARRAGFEGRVWVRFVLDRRGDLLDSELVASSGHALLDRAALELLDRAEPFPSLPDDTGLDQIELVLPVDYLLARGGRG